MVNHTLRSGNDYQVKILLIIKQILPVSTLGKCLDISMENMHTDFRVLKVRYR